ncbi:MAG: hypothetical protein ABIG55_05940 [Candidatus Omnitrophota bacterium]|nr:hypothetical protein [Candidatus Omnitrophota bacterium]
MDKQKQFPIFYFLLVFLVSLLSFSGEARSENWYLLNEYDIPAEESGTFRMRVAARLYEEKKCYELAGKRKRTMAGGALISTDCVSGEEYDTALKEVFDKIPADETYIYLKDEDGNDTVIDFMDVPEEKIDGLAVIISDKCIKEGFSDIILITKKGISRPAGTGLFIGADQAAVRRVKGEPPSVIGRVWFYGKDMIIFDDKGRVKDYSDFSGSLGIKE